MELNPSGNFWGLMAKSLSYSYNQYICKTPLNIYLEYQLKDPTEIGHGTELQSEEKILHL